MMKLMLSATFAAALLMAACKDSPEPSKPERAAPDFAGAITLSPRFDPATSEVAVSVDLRPGYHVYTTGETTGRPLALALDPASSWRAAGEPEYPDGKKKQTSLGTSVVVEDHAEVRLAVEPKTEADPGPVRGHLRYQVCTESACDRPRELEFELPASS
jgi:DsbC/DsbD-like thiol-disulfide interchange protein